MPLFFILLQCRLSKVAFFVQSKTKVCIDFIDKLSVTNRQFWLLECSVASLGMCEKVLHSTCEHRLFWEAVTIDSLMEALELQFRFPFQFQR